MTKCAECDKEVHKIEDVIECILCRKCCDEGMEKKK